MSYNNPSATPNFTGYDPLARAFCATEASLQVGAWQGPTPSGWTKPFSVLEALPAATRLVISGTGVKQAGAPGQYTLQISLSQQSSGVQLSAATTGATNNQSNGSPVAPFTWVTNPISSKIATVPSSGLLVPKSKGYVDVIVTYPKAVSASAPGMPLGTDVIYATLSVTVVS